jgi:hypothetical protein
MSFALLFAILMILWALSWFWTPAGPYGPYVNNVVLWILLALLGWHVFGPLLHP